MTTHPAASSTSTPARRRPASDPTSATRRRARARRRRARRPRRSTRPPRISSSPRRAVDRHVQLPRSEQAVEAGHAHGDAVGDLLGDERGRPLGDLGRDLDAAVHRARVHHERVLAQPRGALDGEPVARGVLAQAREQRRVAALVLDAQQVDDVDVVEHRVEVVAHAAPASRRATTGSSVGGATSVTSAPSAENASTSLRATREWRMSPTIAMRGAVERTAAPPPEVAAQREARRAAPGWGARGSRRPR